MCSTHWYPHLGSEYAHLETQLTLPLLLRFQFPQALPPPFCHFSAVLILDPAHLFLDQKEAPSFDFRSSTYTKVSIPLLRKRCLSCRAQTFSSTFATFLLPPLRKRFHFCRSPIFSSTFAFILTSMQSLVMGACASFIKWNYFVCGDAKAWAPLWVVSFHLVSFQMFKISLKVSHESSGTELVVNEASLPTIAPLLMNKRPLLWSSAGNLVIFWSAVSRKTTGWQGRIRIGKNWFDG